jgi:hypothetical protein
MTGRTAILIALLSVPPAVSARAACPTCAKLVGGQPIAQTYTMTAITGPKRCAVGLLNFKVCTA